MYDDRVVTKIEFYKENRPEHLQKYLEGKNVAIDKFIDDLIILKNIGVEITNIKFKDTIYSLAKKSGIEKKELDNLGLDPEYYIGHHYDRIKQEYRSENYNYDDEQIKKILTSGIILEKRNTIDEFIEKIRLLRNLGINVSNLGKKDTIRELANKFNVDIEIIEQNELNLDENIYNGYKRIIKLYRDTKEKGVKPTEEQIEELKD